MDRPRAVSSRNPKPKLRNMTGTAKPKESENLPEVNLKDHSSIASFLISQQGKQKVKQLRDLKKGNNADSRQLQESNFLAEVSKIEDFEKLKQVKWFECLGSGGLSPEEETEIRAKRQEEIERENRKLVTPPVGVVVDKNYRVRSQANTRPLPEESEFEPFQPIELLPLERFRTAGYKVITLRRLKKNLSILKKLVGEARRDPDAIGLLVEKQVEAKQSSEQIEIPLNIVASNIKPASFPHFLPTEKQRLPVPITQFVTARPPHHSFDLQEPLAYKLKGYSSFDYSVIHDATPCPMKPLEFRTIR